MNEETNLNEDKEGAETEGESPKVGDAPKKEKRPRIVRKEIVDKGTYTLDEKEFKACLGSKNAREVGTVAEYINLELWYDKHYIIERNQHPDDNGNQRDVPPEAVEALVRKAFKHLLFYSSAVKTFHFLNHEDSKGIIRTIIKDSPKNKPLSVACQVHFKNFNRYQFSVITAMDGDIPLSAGQHFIEFVDESCSILKKFDDGKVTPVFTCQD